MATFDSYQGFFKVARLRMQDAEELGEPPTLHPQMSDAAHRHDRGAMYVAGYAIECVLKAYIISVAPDNPDGTRPTSLVEATSNHLRQGRTLPPLTTAKGHDITLLIDEAELTPLLAIGDPIAIHASVCQKWRHTMRYDPSPPKTGVAHDFVASSRVFYDWIRGRIV